MKNIIPLLAILTVVVLSSCDKVNSPYSEIEVAPDDTSGGEIKKRKVLIEDFTGHRCPNCPRAAETIEAIKLLRPGRIISIGEHVTSVFAAPASGIYNIDFRTAVSFSNDSLFGMSLFGLPTGMVNRLTIAGSRRIEYPKWGEVADSLLNLPAEAFITIDNVYDSTTRTITSTLKSDFLKSLSSNYKLVVYIIEDSIKHAQKDNLIQPSGNDSDYVHQHVLRGSVNGTFGELLNSTPVNSSSTFTKTYTKVLSASWKEKHCSIVAFIYDELTKEVIQAEEHPILD